MNHRNKHPWLFLAAVLNGACDVVVSDTFSFPEQSGAGTAGAGGESGAGGGEDCPLGGQAWLRIANVLDEPGRAHLCVRYAGESTYYVVQSAAHGFVDGMPPATVTRYRSISSGRVSIGMAPLDATEPCARPAFTQDLCLQADAHGTVVMAGDRGTSPPTAALQYLQDLSPEDIDETRSYSRIIHALPTPPPERPRLDGMVWSTVSDVWILPFRNLQFGLRPVSQAKLDPFNPINKLGYISGYFGIDTVKTLEMILPLTLDLGGFFRFSEAQIEAYHGRPSWTPENPRS